MYDCYMLEVVQAFSLDIHGVDVTSRQNGRRAAGAKKGHKPRKKKSRCHFILICFRISVLAILESGSFVGFFLSGLLF